MPHKQVLFRSAAREQILRGATQLADAIRVTLEPRSKLVLIEKKCAPIVCNDGVTIAKEFELKDPEENLGARMPRQAAERTGDMVGDVTSTSTILAHAILADGIRNVVAGASAIEIKRGLDRATKRAIETLRVVEHGAQHAVVRREPAYREPPYALRLERLREPRVLQRRVSIAVRSCCLVDHQRLRRQAKLGGKVGSRRPRDAMRRPRSALGAEGTMIGAMPVTARDDSRAGSLGTCEVLAERGDDRIAVRHAERAAGKEVALDIHDEQGVARLLEQARSRN
jgi:hypothetical protein